jgi:HK97 family phage prohead protease
MPFTREQADIAAKALNVNFDDVDFTIDDFLRGMNVELEHGTVNAVTNLTDDEPVKTAKIALAHLNESPLYYDEKIGLEAWEDSLDRNTKSDERKREHKAFKFELESTGEDGEFSGYAAVFGNRDNGDDIIEKGAFAKTIGEDIDRIKILSQHNDCELPIGRPLELREDEKGLFIRGKISNTHKGRDIRTLLKDGVLNELSIGYDPVIFDLDYDSGECVRRLKEIKLWEVSIVTWAMNDQAKIDDVKSLVEGLKIDAKSGKITRARLDALKPFIAVVRELADILSPFLEPLAQTEETEPLIKPPTQSNIKKQAKNAGMIFEIIPSKNRR